MIVASGNNEDCGRGRGIKPSRKELADKNTADCVGGSDSVFESEWKWTEPFPLEKSYCWEI